MNGISVIIPVYNQAQLVERCLCSVMASKLKEIEIILIDDGSYDTSHQIMSSYVKRDSRIVLVGG